MMRSTVVRVIGEELEIGVAGTRNGGGEIASSATRSCIYEKGNRQNCPGVNGGYCRHPGRCPIIVKGEAGAVSAP